MYMQMTEVRAIPFGYASLPLSAMHAICLGLSWGFIFSWHHNATVYDHANGAHICFCTESFPSFGWEAQSLNVCIKVTIQSIVHSWDPQLIDTVMQMARLSPWTPIQMCSRPWPIVCFSVLHKHRAWCKLWRIEPSTIDTCKPSRYVIWRSGELPIVPLKFIILPQRLVQTAPFHELHTEQQPGVSNAVSQEVNCVHWFALLQYCNLV